MSIGKRITLGVFASWLNRAVAIGLNLLFIPLLFRYMGKEELGIWFLLGQGGAFLALMDMGAAPVLIRHIAFSVASGSGREELADLLVVARVFYRIQAIAVFLLAWFCGVLFIGLLNFEQIGRETAIIAWSILCFGHGLTVWAGVWPCILQGAGHIGSSILLGTAVNILVTITQIIAVLLGGGLIELALIFVIGSIVARYSNILLLHYKEADILSLKGQWNARLFRKLTKPALKSWATALGGFLILKTDQFFIASFKGVTQIPAYHAAYQIISNIYMLSVALAGASGVYISYLWENKSLVRLRKIVIRNMQIALSIMICGIACMVWVGHEIIDLWLGIGNFIGIQVILLFCITMFLQTQHEMMITFTRATGDEGFVISSLMAGGINILLTIILIKPLGIIGVAASTLIAQLLTNNWYGVYRGTQHLGISLQRYFAEVLVPVLVVGFCALTFGYGILHIVETSIPSIWRITLVVLINISVLICALSYFTRTERLKYAQDYFSRGLIK